MTNKGDDKERQLVNRVNEWERCHAYRLAASGGGAKFELPDIKLSLDGDVYAGEMKYTTTGKAEIRRQEIQDLAIYCAYYDVKPICVLRFSHDTSFYVVPYGSEAFTDVITKQARNAIFREESKKEWRTVREVSGLDESPLDF